MAVILERSANDCAISAWKDGTLLVAEQLDNSVRIAISSCPWDEWNEVKGCESAISCLACPFNRPTLFVSGSSDGHLVVWEIEEILMAVDGACPAATWWDGNEYSLCDQYCRLGKDSYRAGCRINATPLKTFDGNATPVIMVSCSADGGLIVSGTADSNVHVLSFATGQELYKLKGCYDLRCIDMSADGSLIAVGCEREVQLWRSGSETKSSERPRTSTSPQNHTGQHKLIQTSKARDEVTCVAVSADATYVVFGSADKTVHVCRSSAVHILHYDAPINAVAISAGGTFITVATASDQLCVWETKKGQLSTLDCKGTPATHLATSSDDSIMGTICAGHITRVWAWLAVPEPKALQRVAQFAAWQGCPWLLHSRINVLGTTETGKTSLIRALAGDAKQGNAPEEHCAPGIDVTYCRLVQTPGTEKVHSTTSARDIAGYHQLAWQKAVVDKMVELRNEGRATSEGNLEVLSRCSVSPDGRHSWSPLKLSRRKVSDAVTPPEDAKDRSHHHFKHLRAWVDKGRHSPAVVSANESNTATTPAPISATQDCSFDIPELNDIIPQLYSAETDAVLYDRMKRIALPREGKAVVYKFGSFPGHDVLYPLLLTKDAYHLIVFNMQELQPGEDDGPRNIHGKTQKVTQWREQCMNQIKLWAELLKDFEDHNIMLVGTHRNIVYQQDDHRAIHKLLYAEFKERFLLNFKEELCFFPVNTTAGMEDEFINHLRYRTTWREQKIPVKRLRFLTALERKQKPLITLDEALTAGKEHAGMDKDEVRSTLSFFHCSGLLAWWPDIEDGAYVVLDLPWLIAKIAPILMESKTAGTPLGTLLGKVADTPTDQMALLHALARRLAA